MERRRCCGDAVSSLLSMMQDADGEQPLSFRLSSGSDSDKSLIIAGVVES